jgi:hypothetical protein
MSPAIASAAGSRAKRVAANEPGDRERGWKPGEAGRRQYI